MSNQLLAPSFLFRFAAPCRYAGAIWSPKGKSLGEEYRLPSFTELDDVPQRVVVAAAWNEQGLCFNVTTSGKKQLPWCRENKIEDSDGFYVWVDTRDTHNIHRASRFCHQFVFLPGGTGSKLDEPIAEILAINRARESPKPLRRNLLQVVSHKLKDGYRLECFIPAEGLTGWEPSENPKLGFHWAIADREIGEHTFCCPPGLPYKDDPSVWGTLEMVK